MAKKKAQAKSSRKKTSSKAKRKGPKPGSKRTAYSDSLKQKVVKAVRKGMTHLEASEHFSVGKHSIPNWLKRFV